jgi:amino acid permease
MNKFIFAYSCLTNFLSVAEALKNPSKKNLTFILVMTFLSQFVVVMAIGLMSYL